MGERRYPPVQETIAKGRARQAKQAALDAERAALEEPPIVTPAAEDRLQPTSAPPLTVSDEPTAISEVPATVSEEADVNNTDEQGQGQTTIEDVHQPSTDEPELSFQPTYEAPTPTFVEPTPEPVSISPDVGETPASAPSEPQRIEPFITPPGRITVASHRRSPLSRGLALLICLIFCGLGSWALLMDQDETPSGGNQTATSSPKNTAPTATVQSFRAIPGSSFLSIPYASSSQTSHYYSSQPFRDVSYTMRGGTVDDGNVVGLDVPNTCVTAQVIVDDSAIPARVRDMQQFSVASRGFPKASVAYNERVRLKSDHTARIVTVAAPYSSLSSGLKAKYRGATWVIHSYLAIKTDTGMSLVEIDSRTNCTTRKEITTVVGAHIALANDLRSVNKADFVEDVQAINQTLAKKQTQPKNPVPQPSNPPLEGKTDGIAIRLMDTFG